MAEPGVKLSEWVSQAGAAVRLGVGRARVGQLVDAGRLDVGVTDDGVRLVSAASVERYARERAERAARAER